MHSTSMAERPMPCSQCTSRRRATDLRAPGEGDPLVDHRRIDGGVVMGRQVQEDQPAAAPEFRIVAILGSQVDDRADSVLPGEGFRRAPSRTARRSPGHR
jgi:hypothetical protein